MIKNANPRKKGKKYALKQARKLEKTEAELLELSFRHAEKNDKPRCSTQDTHSLLIDDLYFEFCDAENYPIFSFLTRHNLDDFVKIFMSSEDLFIKMDDSIKKHEFKQI
jgi:hypothetical protein